VQEIFLQSLQIDSGTQAVFYSMGIMDSFNGDKAVGAWSW